MKQQRSTRQRRMVLEVVQSSGAHLNADEIYLIARELDQRISRGTVYRNLQLLSERGQITRMRLPGIDRYDARTDPHHHLICRECGAVSDIPWTYDDDLDEELSSETGYRVERHRTVFEGVCPRCRSHPQS